ncbi:MAG: M23 family metallopeptidase [Hydrogenothermaceae bacterium]|nr:M23 family metallopeptidase [Hydrogenothermaceae bacterium]
MKVEDRNSGVKAIKVSVIQNGRTVVVLEQQNLNQRSVYLNIPILPQKLGLVEGGATLKVKVSNGSWIRRHSMYEKAVRIDFTPPVISIVNWTKSIMNGGTGFIFFKSSEPLAEKLVKVGKHSFRCLEFSYGYICPFTFPYFETEQLPINLQVKDLADNILVRNLPYSFKKIDYANSTLTIDDNFIESEITTISDKEIQDKTQLFKYVNVDIRKRNEDTIHRVSSECKNRDPLFEGQFSYLENSAKLGGFADYRKYSYKGRIIEGADAYHKGLDFASTRNAPVKASNRGEVVFTGFLGIYGNSVIVDHGLCVYSIYSHLDEIYVKMGQMVDKSTVIGKTGTTGLAVGDHLHYGILVNGIEVNPIEWFDKKWLETRFYSPYKQLKGG